MLLWKRSNCTLLAVEGYRTLSGAMHSHAMLFVIAAAAALTPLPQGINAYEVAAGTRNRPAEALAPVALRAIAAAREANVKLGEIEFPALLGEKTAYDDVDNVKICAVMNWHRNAIEQASRRWRGGRRDESARTRRKILISPQVGGQGAGEAAAGTGPAAPQARRRRRLYS